MKGFFQDKMINRRIVKESPLISPLQLLVDIPRTDKETEVVGRGRKTIENILEGRDSRIMIIVGPCSIHKVDEAKEYARNLASLSKRVRDKMVIIMRCYFEKPRTSLGWKGLVNDPCLDGSNDINMGLRLSRQLLKFNAGLGLLSGTEYLSLITPQYLGDFVSWSAIGARTTESPEHRSLASGLSVPVGFKNGTNGNVDIAINAVLTSRHRHSFEGTTMANEVAIFETSGNPYTHVILRGGDTPNYDEKSIRRVQEKLKKHSLEPNIVVDCSHGNSGKDYSRQPAVFMNVINQIIKGNNGIKGIMLESYIREGSQELKRGKKLKYGVSITDGCLGWRDTEELILKGYTLLKK
jgi:3-deoxy-7-phosphoheptulonate synthase